jgi:6-phosphogluconolactonase
MNSWITGNDENLADRAAVFITATAYRAVAERGRFTLLLSGGSTPKKLYEKLAKGLHEELFEKFGYNLPARVHRSVLDPEAITLPWPETFMFQGDERYVPVNHPDSNYGMLRETLMRHTCIRLDNIFNMPIESGEPEEDALSYEELLRSFFRKRDTEARAGFPAFDLVLLGIGGDGHTASLFPEDRKALGELEKWVIAVNAPGAKPPGARLTLTLPVINHARTVLFLVPAERSELAFSIHEGKRPDLPAGMVRPVDGDLFWFVAEPSHESRHP